MAELLTIQDSIDGHLDTQTLKEAVNEDKMITARLGLEYASVPMASRLFVESGLLGATPFSTYTAMTGSSLANNSYAIITNDADLAKNGFYQKISAVWTLLKWNPNVNSLRYMKMLDADTDIKTVSDAGFYTLSSSRNYIGLPTEAVGEGCQLEVTVAVDGVSGFVIQKLTVHARSERFWTRRVQKSSTSPANNTAGSWYFSLDAVNPNIITDLQAYAQTKASEAVSTSMRSVTFSLPTDSKLADQKGVGIYTLRSSYNYPDLPIDFPSGEGAVLEVIAITAGYRLQRLTQHSKGNKVWTRRVTYSDYDATINSPETWFSQTSSSGSSNASDLADLPTTEKTLSVGSVWNDHTFVRVKQNWSYLYTQTPTTSIIGDLTKLYAFYDNLMAEFPDYITRETLGVDAWDLPIYQYLLKPPARRLYEYPAKVGKRPKVVLTSGTHGGERGAQMGLMIFVDNLCRNWDKLEDYGQLRFNTEFVIIPATIPSSVQDATRKNRNGVDANRNFDWMWGMGDNPSQDPEHSMYQGASAASEVDVQVLQTQIPLQHSDAILLVENHNHNNPQAFWVGSNTPSVMHIGLEAADEITPYLFKEIIPDGDTSRTTVFVSRNYEGSFAGYMENAGIPAILIETSGVVDFPQNDNTVPSLRRMHELLLLTIVKKSVAKELRNRAENFALV